MSIKTSKHFVTVGNRRVHYLRAGSGPAVVLLHASPCSAKVLRQTLEVFAGRFNGPRIVGAVHLGHIVIDIAHHD